MADPGAGAARHRRLTQLFAESLGLAPDARAAFLASACGDDAELRREVVDLLARGDSELPLPAIPAIPDVDTLHGEAIAAGESDEDAASANAPIRLGRYRILRHLGRGGMADVYEAEQDQPRRSVAIKILRADVSGASLQRRFRLEAHVLGQLLHPGIARIYEAGVARAELANGVEVDLPFFAMEHVRGVPVLAFAKQRALSLAQRLELVARVCDAVQHAHERGVVHRDLKPDNILVEDESSAGGDTPHDAKLPVGVGQPKVLDFGVALAVGVDALASTAHTIAGQLVGTLAYMSPEQARGSNDEVDARSDVYSLGVILYELLSGRLPYSLHGPSLADLARAIQEDDPERLGALRPELRGDVETIVAFALEKDRDRRYASAAALAADLRRTLRDEPIVARPPSLAYRLAKFARRNRALVAGVAAAFLALAIGTVVSIYQATEAKRASRTAERLAYRMSLAAASSALRSHQVAEARRLFDQAPPALRGWEWRHLVASLDQSLSRIEVPGARLVRVVFRPDGRAVAVASDTGTVTVWNPDDGRALGSFETSKGPNLGLVDLAYTSDGARLVTVERNLVDKPPCLPVTIRDAATLQVISSSNWEAGMIAFDAPADRAVTIEPNGRHVVRDVSDGRVVAELVAFADAARATRLGSVSHAAYSSVSHRVALAYPEATGFELCSSDDGSIVRSDPHGANTLAFDRSGTRVAVGLYEPTTLVLDSANGRDVARLSGHEAGIAAVAFGADASTLATASQDGTLRLWSTESGLARLVLHGHEGRIRDLCFSPDQERLASAAEDGTVRFWDARGGAESVVLKHPHTVYAAAFAPDGKRIITGCIGGTGTLRVWDAVSGELVAAWMQRISECIAVRADGARILVGCNGAPTQELDAATGAVVASVPGHGWTTNAVEFDPRRPRFLTSGNDGALKIVDSETGEVLRTTALGTPSGPPIFRALYARDGSSIVASRTDGSIAVLDADTLEVRREMRGHTRPIEALAIDAAGSRIASGSMDGEVRLWDLAKGVCIATLHGHDRETFALAFSPDGARLASGGRDRTIRIWDTATFEEVALLRGHTSFVFTLAFSPDGTQLVSGGGDDTARIWDVRPLADIVRARAERRAAMPAAEARVDALWKELGDAARVAARLSEDRSLSDRDRELALQAVLRRATQP